MPYQPHVWYDFSLDRRRPLRLDVAGFTRDADAVLWRDLRLAEMQDRRWACSMWNTQ